MTLDMNDFTILQRSDEHIHLAFASPKRVMNSAILNGGLVNAEHILNRKVPKHSSSNEAPEDSLHCYAEIQGWRGQVVGMMTATPMSSLCV